MGAGESASVPSAAAVANAIFDATGVRLLEVPFTPSRVLAALKAAKRRRRLVQVTPPIKNIDMRTFQKILAGGAAVVVVLAAAGLALTHQGEIAPQSAIPAADFTPQQIAKGKLLAAMGDCAVCHTAPSGKTNAGGLAMPSPFGTIYTSNTRPICRPASAAGAMKPSSAPCATAWTARASTSTLPSLHGLQPRDG
jgi:hypothetical protein